MTKRIKLFLFVLIPWLIILFFTKNIILLFNNPSWGDMVSIPYNPIPIRDLFNPWQDIYSGTFGGQYMPHFLLSQLVGIINPTILQYIYLFFLFVVLYISFLDFFRYINRTRSSIDEKNIILAGLGILLIFFSNVFIVNLIQGNPDTYYPYLLGIPVILYLYRLIIDNDLASALKISLLVTIATWFGSFAIYYQVLLVIPFFILFASLFVRKNIRRLSLLFILIFIFVTINNLPYLFMTLKPILTAIGHVSGRLVGSPVPISEFFSLYRGFNLLNLFYFAGNPGDVTGILFNIPGGSVYNQNVFYSFLPLQIVLVLGFLIFNSRKEGKIPLLLIGMIGILLMFIAIILLWDTELFINIAHHLPLFALFRNPKKIILSLYVAFILIVFFSGIYIKVKRYITFLIIILFINILAIAPLLLDGYGGLKNAYNARLEFYKLDTNEARIAFSSTINFPSRFLNLKQHLTLLDREDNSYHYRIIVIPDNTQTLYQSSLRYIYNAFFVNPTQAVWGNLDSSFNLMTYLYASISQEKTNTITNVLRVGNIKYIIIDRKSPYTLYTDKRQPGTREYYGTFTTGDPEYYAKILKNKRELSLVFYNSDFYIFRNNKFTEQSFYIPNAICSINRIENVERDCDFIQSTKISHSELNTSSSRIKNIVIRDPSHFSFTLTSEKKGEAVIFFSQSFDPFWTLSSSTDAKVTKHSVGNSFGNVWEVSIPRRGIFTFDAVYSLQRPYHYIVIFSIIGIIGNIFALIYIVYINSKTKKK